MATLRACGNNDLETTLLFNATSGTPAFTNSGVNGADVAALELVNGDQAQVYTGNGSPTNDVVAGFYFKHDTVVASTFASWEAGGTDPAFSINIDGSGNIDIEDNGGTVVANGSGTPLSATDTWYLVEFIFDQATSTTGTLTVYVNGSSAVSVSAQNFTTSGNANKLRFHGHTSGTEIRTFGAWYVYEGGTGVSDFLGDFEILTLMGDGTTSTGGDAWDSGSWANVSELPYNGSNTASYTQNAALSGYREDQGGSYAGPNGVSGIGTIHGITYCAVADRGGGSGAGDQKDLLGGNSVDGTTNLLSMGLARSEALYSVSSESASVVPTDSEYSRIGFAHNGARDMNIFEAWSSLLYEPASGTNVSVSVSGLSATGSVGQETIATGTGVTVAETGLSATGSVGSVSLAYDYAFAISGLSATGSVGSVSVSTDAILSVSGLSATGNVGSVSVGFGQALSVSGLSATGAVGSTSVTGDAMVSETGLSATGSVGSVTTITVTDVTVPVTGLSATGSVGTATVDVTETNTVTGLSATGSVGSVSVTGDANVTLGDLAATGSVGTIVAGAMVSVSPTGVAGTGTVGSLSVSGDAIIAETGLSATGNVGSVTVTADGTVSISGLAGTGNAGSVSISTGVLTAISGLAATSSVGSVTVGLGSNVSISGVAGTGTVGSVTIVGETGANVSISGLAGTAAVGSLTVDVSGTVAFLNGVSATASVGGFAAVYGVHDPSQNPAWTTITPSQTPSYSTEAPAQTPSWTEEEPSQDPSWAPVSTE